MSISGGKMDLLVPVAYGIEAAAKREIERLGFGHAPAVRGRIALSGGWEDVAKLNVFLRAGERVLILLGAFHADTFDALFEGVFSLPWEEFLSPHACILIDGKSVKSKLAAVKAAGGVVKKAILKRLGEKLRVRTFDEKGERALVGVSIFEDEVQITLDTSGEGLHRRGYRVLTGEAPLRETTAAAIIEDSVYKRDKAFADPFCGSGTLPIEAALYARNIAPGKNRPFDFERWKCVPHGISASVRAAAREEEYRGPIAPVYASDISPKAVETAREHARRANVFADIRFSVGDVKDFSAPERYGVLISNPPYGERLDGFDLAALYRDFAAAFRSLPDWSAYFLTAFGGAERAFGKADKRRLLYNAGIACSLFAFFGAKPSKYL